MGRNVGQRSEWPFFFSHVDFCEGMVQLWSHDSVEGAVIIDRPNRQESQFAISFQPPVPAARKEEVVERADSLEQSQGEWEADRHLSAEKSQAAAGPIKQLHGVPTVWQENKERSAQAQFLRNLNAIFKMAETVRTLKE